MNAGTIDSLSDTVSKVKGQFLLPAPEQYRRDGYVVIRNGGCDVPQLFDVFNKLYYEDIEKYKSWLALVAKAPFITEMFTNNTTQDILKHLGIEWPIPPTHPVFHVMGLPIPGGYNGTVAHQDWPSIQGSLDMVTVWIPFMDIGIDNYPLEVIPGSHKHGLCDGVINGSVLAVEAEEKDFIPLECKAGDIIILSGFIIHRTGEGKGFRVAASQRFDNAIEPTFMERNFPCAQKRVVDREVRWHPSVEQVRGIYA